MLEYSGISNTYWKIGVGIFWDIENIRIPKESQLQDILNATRKKN
jgi:hypothetical protein